MKKLALAALSALTIPACTPQSQQAIPAGIGQSAYAPALAERDFTVTPFNAPDSVFPGVTSTEPTGVRNGLITATLSFSGGATTGALYRIKLKRWSKIAVPKASSTAAYGPQTYDGGYRIVGSYKSSGSPNDHGFIFDSSGVQFIRFDAPPSFCAPHACNQTIAHSVYGNSRYRVVGNYDSVGSGPAGARGHAFLYDSSGKSFATIDYPSAISTTAYGIWADGGTVAVAGGFTDKTGNHAYVRTLDGKNSLVYNYPHAAVTHFEGITGMGGAGNYAVVGDYSGLRSGAPVYGFYMEIHAWKAWPPIAIGRLSANSVQGRTVIGVYKNAGALSGYQVTVPVQDPP